MLGNYLKKRIWNLTRIKYYIKHNTDTYSEIDSFTRWNWRPIWTKDDDCARCLELPYKWLAFTDWIPVCRCLCSSIDLLTHYRVYVALTSKMLWQWFTNLIFDFWWVLQHNLSVLKGTWAALSIIAVRWISTPCPKCNQNGSLRKLSNKCSNQFASL